MQTEQKTLMKAAVRREYGPPDVLRLDDVEVPAIAPDQVLVGVRAAGVDPGVLFFLTGHPRVLRAVAGIGRPKHPVLGRAVAGRVEAVGAAVTRFAVGDEVYGELPHGAYAEYAAAPEKLMATKPAGLSFAEAAAVPLSGTTALQCLRDAGRLRPGAHVLVNGASGGVGTFAVQIAKALGARVTAVCSPDSAPLVAALGADHVLDRTREDYTDAGPRYDLVLDLVGNHTLARNHRVLAPGGRLVLSAGPPAPSVRRTLAALVSYPFLGRKVVPGLAVPRADDLDRLREMIDSGAVRPVVERTYPLAEAAEALRKQATGHARGKTVLTVP
ncbi:NAD(P)-dependent alcohol dehydrogenase [Pseudonocardia lacus]|uniref:NAD(P)-dependent alcohol dehydrogenase n=1 Tax=Pseudonocardia lacus TaxID=2835865 RepID=UPI002028BE1C|nr:NAD(P)-dependent alcohol dehydrogenase [Pseudonocardia lacus]